MSHFSTREHEKRYANLIEPNPIVGILRQTRLDQAWALLTATLDHYGFDRVLYGRTHFANGHFLGDERHYIMLSNHEPAYVRHFITEKRFQLSPFFIWSFNNTGFISWSETDKLDIPEAARPMAMKIAEENRNFDVTAGITASFANTRPSQKSTASICARRGISQDEVDDIWAHNRDVLEGSMLAFDLKCLTLPAPEHKNLLTQKQREVLEWVAAGKSVDDIAVIMDRSRSTIEKHLSKSREMLEVTSNAQAVAKLIFLNQLHFARDNENTVKDNIHIR